MNAVTQNEVLELEQPEQSLPAVQRGGAIAEGSPVGIMMAGLARGLTPADIREMMAIQREWRADEARNAFNQAMAAFKAEPVYVAKSKDVGYTTKDGEFVGYKHAELCDVVAAVGPALAKHGLSHRWDVKQSKDWISVTCVLKHADGHSESCEMGGPPDNSGKKNQIQQIASTVSYLQRYTLKAITGVAEGGEDDDGAGGAEAGAPSKKRTESAPDTYPDADFQKNLASWREVITSKRKSPDELIAFVEKRKPLTDLQKATLRGLVPAA